MIQAKKIGAICCRSLVFLLLPLAFGCVDAGVALVPPAELFPEIEFVVLHRDEFAQNEDNPLGNVNAGKIRDEIENLDGCWASYDVFVNDDGTAPPGTLALQDYEFYRFDFETGTYEWQVLQRGPNFLLGVFIEAMLSREGVFEATGPNRSILTTTRISGNDPLTGELFTMPLEPEQVSERLITVEGDHMKIRFADDGEVDLREDLVFTRFECFP